MQALSGYALEPWKPVTGETLFRRESGAVASQFHDPPSIEPYSSAARRGRARASCSARRAGSTRSASRRRSSGSTCPRSARADAAREGEGARHAQARARHRRRVPGARGWLTTTRSSSAAASTRSRAARCSRARAGASACSSATTGSAARSTRRS